MTDSRLLPFLALAGLLAAKTTTGSFGVVRRARDTTKVYVLKIYAHPDYWTPREFYERSGAYQKAWGVMHKAAMSEKCSGDVTERFATVTCLLSSENLPMAELHKVLDVASVDDWTLDPV
jgi:hypothetical protein